MLSNKKGLTLLEVIIALLIFTIMSSAIFGAFIASARMDMSSKSFTEARGIAQAQIERIYYNSQSLSYADTLYQLITVDQFTCSGFSWTIDLVSGAIIYSEPANIVSCTKVNADFSQSIVFKKDLSFTTVNMVQIDMKIDSINPNVKRYETLYATEFK